MSESKPATDACKRKFYEQPAVKKLNLEEAKKLLETQPERADENTEKMLNEITRRLTANN